ncbi:MAG: MFS transporter [Crocinitomicaceae bacterium]|nr:MFS transporter [Crocinitomicaceae bacterium]
MNLKSISKQEISAEKTSYSILLAICFAHLINDLLQSILPSIYPMIQKDYSLSFSQIGMITFTFQITASLLQPFVGFYTDKKPQPYSFLFGMILTLFGIILLSFASSFYTILLAAGVIGLGSSVFHPEASKLAYFASGGKRGLAQSIFQLGGNTGSAIGPLLVALIVAVYGQQHILWFLIFSVIGIFILLKVGKWYANYLSWRATSASKRMEENHNLTKKQVIRSVLILLILIFSKFFYTASMTNYFTFYLIDKFGVSVQQSQFYLFVFLASVAAGTLLGGPIGDKYGRRVVMKFSILGVAPFTLLMPHVNFELTILLAVLIGLILSSAFSAIIVYAQELLPGRIGMVSGLFFGFAFGMGGLGSALLGRLADQTSIGYVFYVCSFLPLIGLFIYFLPSINNKK